MLDNFKQFEINHQRAIQGGQMASASGAPGAGVNIRVRGIGSVHASSGQPGGSVNFLIR